MLHPAVAENFPNSVLEGMACATPAAAFNTGGVPDIVRHLETGYLACYKDVGDLARGILLLLDNAELRSRMGRRCREIAEQEYSLELQAQRYEQLYRETIEYHRTRRAGDDKRLKP